ncbi:ABC transporter ATP-binding protein [Rarobacter incanus]|uniref:ABC-2 type transport system ATP-binding protein n=1 Tax=Rarobacter incanus TaxID=153494 RepID=A0A542SLW5_9MICO|nr:ATP-binding cassette domain-containing protein [Rarobacter incanus]TQK75612.1 ABC-2 type transport system ATP-binding protein [Rarobacter incanus]
MRISVRNISKSFGATRALDDVSFDIEPGTLTGFVGGNGAGKTTAMRIIIGVLLADRGEVTKDNAPLTQLDRRAIGYMPEERGLYPKMRVGEQLEYLARLHGLSARRAKSNARDLVERLGLEGRINDPIEQLSLGNQQRAQIAAALVHGPDLLILDEPFSGLDPMAVDVVLGVLQQRAADGVPILLSSHQLDVVERICEHLVIIAGGRIKAQGPREQLREQHSPPRYRLVGVPAGGIVRPGVSIIESSATDSVVFDSPDPLVAQSVARDAALAGTLREFAPVRPSLAEIFREVVVDHALSHDAHDGPTIPAETDAS